MAENQASSESRPSPDTVRRINLSVPAADESVLRWFDVQDNKSISVRMIVREYIERHGFTDPMCLPVEQGPRRGRPPMGGAGQMTTYEQSKGLVLVNNDSADAEDDERDDAEVAAKIDERIESSSTAQPEPETSASSDDFQLDENGMPVIDY